MHRPETANARAQYASVPNAKVMGEEHFTKRSKKSGQFMAQKEGATKFKGVRKEKSKEGRS